MAADQHDYINDVLNGDYKINYEVIAIEADELPLIAE